VQRAESLRAERCGVLRSLQSGFYELPVGDPVWEKLVKLGLVVMREPPHPPRQLTSKGARYPTLITTRELSSTL
jgi:hypothetical protein